MYEITLTVHSLLRTAAIVLVAIAFLRSFQGMFAGRMYTSGDRQSGLLAIIVLDLQLVLGLVLHLGMSPVTQSAFSNMGAAMKDPELRKWTVEHPTLMLVAIVVAHVGSALKKRCETDALRHRWTAITLGAALALILVGMPWWGGENARPFFRF